MRMKKILPSIRNVFMPLWGRGDIGKFPHGASQSRLYEGVCVCIIGQLISLRGPQRILRRR